MKLVIGGMAQGKLDYVKKEMIHSDEEFDIIDCRENSKALEEDSLAENSVLVLYKFNYLVKKSISQENTDFNLEKIMKHLSERHHRLIIISDEVGNGIVPVDRLERKYREKTGRILIELAKQSDEVVRVICGIGQRIK